MRTGFLYSLYLFSKLRPGFTLFVCCHVVSHARTLACPLPACPVPRRSHTDPSLGPHPRPNSKHNQNQPKKHFRAPGRQPAASARTAHEQGPEGCSVTSEPGLSPPGPCFQGRFRFKGKTEVKNKNHPSLRGSASLEGEHLLCLNGAPFPAHQGTPKFLPSVSNGSRVKNAEEHPFSQEGELVV